MGQFSWICSDDNEPLYVGDDGYLLVPKPFQGKYGKAIPIIHYDGYGNVGENDEYDAYDLLAEWNRSRLQIGMLPLMPAREDFDWVGNGEAEEYYERNVRNWNHARQRMEDFRAGLSDELMETKYGEDWKREIGIDIGCYNHQMAKLPYQLKFVHNARAEYDAYDFSPDDPNQGWGKEEDEEDEEDD